jgi:hypothetical protein
MNGYAVQIAGQNFSLLGTKAAIKTQLQGMFSTDEIKAATWEKLSATEVEKIWKSKTLTKEKMKENLIATGKHSKESAEAAIKYLFNTQQGNNVQYIKRLIAKDAGII